MARPVGATTRPQFYSYVNEIDRKEYVAWVRKNYKKDPQLAKWYGDQMFGKAVQSIVTQDELGNNIPITGIVINSPDARKKS